MTLNSACFLSQGNEWVECCQAAVGHSWRDRHVRAHFRQQQQRWTRRPAHHVEQARPFACGAHCAARYGPLGCEGGFTIHCPCSRNISIFYTFNPLRSICIDCFVISICCRGFSYLSRCLNVCISRSCPFGAPTGQLPRQQPRPRQPTNGSSILRAPRA
jgi:hypothetical protein